MLNKLIILIVILNIVACKNQVSDTSKNESIIQPVTDCLEEDDKAPILKGSLNLEQAGSSLTGAKVSWDKASDDCEFSHYEIAIGTSAGTYDVLNFTNIGNKTEYRQKGLNLSYDQDYYYTLKAIDKAGNNSSSLVSSAWKIFTPKSLTGLVLWLDASEKSSISDPQGNHPGDTSFSNEVRTWQDLSTSTAVHHFTANGAQKPFWDALENAVSFNGSNHLMATADHDDINTSVVGQRTYALAIKTDSDITSRQVIYEEGGTVRGINIYIEDNQLHCGFWNERDDGDGYQDYTQVSQSIETNKAYVVSYLYDYSHFTDRQSSDGTIECFVNGSSIGQVSTTSRLHAHSGDIGLGAMNDGSFFPDGAASGDQYYFRGVIYEFLMYNSSHDIKNIKKIDQILQNKWLD